MIKAAATCHEQSSGKKAKQRRKNSERKIKSSNCFTLKKYFRMLNECFLTLNKKYNEIEALSEFRSNFFVKSLRFLWLIIFANGQI